MGATRFGPIDRKGLVGTKMPFQASQPFHRLGGAFVVLDATTGHVAAAVAASTFLFGWWEVPGFSPAAPEVSSNVFTTSSTAGTPYNNVLVGNPLATYHMPSDEALTAAMFGDACDIVVTSSKQMADVTTGTTDILRIVGSQRLVDQALSEVLVQINPAKLQAN
jgi:hypothetical protein